MNRGLFISCEGLDGAGKSTSIRYVIDGLKRRGFDVVLTREPGGTEVGERIRDLLLHNEMDQTTQALLMYAARAQHVAEVIRPALQAGKCVVCDRFEDSSYAYQGGGNGMDIRQLDTLSHLVLGKGDGRLEPDYTWFFDVTVEVAKARLTATRDMDVFERRGEVYFTRVRDAYLRRIQAHPERFLTVDSTMPREEVAATVEGQLAELFGQPSELERPRA